MGERGGVDVAGAGGPPPNPLQRTFTVTPAIVGEVTRGDDMPVKAMVAVLDAHGVVLSTDETDALGMFALPLPRESHEVVVSAHASDGTDHPTIVLPLGPDGLATVGREPRE